MKRSVPKGFDPRVPVPRDLTIGHITRAIEYVEKELADLIDIYHEQANVFSGIVGIYGAKALHNFSPYEKHKHLDTAQQRFPDLRHKKSKIPPEPELSLESKGSKRPWELQSHYDHAGWYIVWRYLIDETQTVKPGRSVVIWRVDVVYLNKTDWKYEGSKAGTGGGGRTHTFGVKEASKKLKGAIVFQHPNIKLVGGKPTPTDT